MRFLKGFAFLRLQLLAISSAPRYNVVRFKTESKDKKTMKIQNVSDAAFKKYGKVITGLDCSDIIAAMAETPCPENVVYVPGAEPGR